MIINLVLDPRTYNNGPTTQMTKRKILREDLEEFVEDNYEKIIESIQNVAGNLSMPIEDLREKLRVPEGNRSVKEFKMLWNIVLKDLLENY